MAYQRKTFTPTRHRIKTPPKNEDLIQKGNTIHAFLAKVHIPLEVLEEASKDINKYRKTLTDNASRGYYNNEGLNVTRRDTAISRFDLWITEATYGYSVAGPTAVSKYYSRNYTHSFKLTPASVKGRCRDENEYDDLADFIREGQIAISQNPENLFRLYIPGAKIDYLGVIEVFRGGFNANNKGVPLAPEFQFDFTIFKDLNDNVQKFGTTARTIIYNFNEDAYWVEKFSDFKNDYIVGALADKILTDDPKSEVNGGFNSNLSNNLQSATGVGGKSSGSAIGAIVERPNRGIEGLGDDVYKQIGLL
jgi:hypothetical protein